MAVKPDGVTNRQTNRQNKYFSKRKKMKAKTWSKSATKFANDQKISKIKTKVRNTKQQEQMKLWKHNIYL